MSRLRRVFRVGKAFRVGPSLAVLHRDYALRGRIDPDAPVTARHRLWIDAPSDIVFGLIADVPGWPAWFPRVHDVDLPDGVRPDATFTWKDRSRRIRSTFAIVDPGREIGWTGTCSGARAVRRHVLESSGVDGTWLTVEESMSGFLLKIFYDSDALRATTGAWLTALKGAAEEAHHDGRSRLQAR
jgi:hypothetical protein